MEDPWGFTTFQRLHGAAKDWLQWPQWERHPTHTAMVITSPRSYVCKLDQGQLMLESPTNVLSVWWVYCCWSNLRIMYLINSWGGGELIFCIISAISSLWWVFFVCHHSQEHLVKQGMKTDQAASLVEVTAAKCSTVKYDVELAEEYIARQVMVTTDTLVTCVGGVQSFEINWHLLTTLFCCRFPHSQV